MVFCFAAFIARAQDPLATRINPDDVYLSSTVYYVMQDSKGFIWMSTDAGVYRYDSYEFEHFSTANGLPDNEIFRIYEDKKHRIWFIPLNGKLSFYQNGKLNTPENNKMLSQIPFTKIVIGEFEDEKGNMYFASKNEMVCKITPEDSVIMSYNKMIYNFLWVENDSVHTIEERLLNRHYNPRGTIYNDQIAIGVYTNVYYKKGRGEFEKLLTLPEKSVEIIFMKLFSDSSLYIGTRKGLYILNPNDTASLHNYFSDWAVTCIEKDFENNLWISTLEDGVHLVQSLNVLKYNEPNLPSKIITCLEKDADNNLWVGLTNDDYAIIDKTGVITNYQFPSKINHDIVNIRHFENESWVVSKSGLLKIANGQKKYYDFYGNDLLRFGKNALILGQEYVLKFNADNFDEEIAYTIATRYGQEKYTLIKSRCNVLAAGKENEAWIGTIHGLFCYRDNVLIDFGKIEPLFKAFIRDIKYDQETGRTYVATNTNGILVLRDDKLEFTITSSDGLPYNDCYAIKILSSEHILASSSNELVTITIDKKPIVNILNISAGAFSNRIFAIEEINGTIYLGTENGLISFARKNTYRNVSNPKIVIQDFIVSSRSELLNQNKTFGYHQNEITISYTGISFRDHQNLSYEYVLEGYDDNWQRTRERNITYKSLPPGKYVFKVKAINRSGIYSETLSIPYTIRTPFWQTWFFYCAIALIAAAIIYYAWKLRLRKIKENYTEEKEAMETEKKLLELEHKAMRLQMNPHFIFNTLNSIKGFYAENDTEKANEYISKFSKLLRSILENTDQVVSLEKEIEYLKLYLDLTQLRYPGKFIYKIVLDENINIEKTGIPPMLVQPFLENSIVHGIVPKQTEGLIQLEFAKSNGQLICYITDNGIGRSAAKLNSSTKEHQSKAIEIINEFIAALNLKNYSEKFTLDLQDLYNERHEPAGTKVIITLPYFNIL